MKKRYASNMVQFTKAMTYWRKRAVFKLSFWDSISAAPAFAIQTPVLNGLGNVLGEYIFAVCQVGNGAAYFDDPVISSGRQV